MTSALRLGLVVNPVAGLGGAAGLMGSDGKQVQAEARRRGSVPRGGDRARRLLAAVAAALAAAGQSHDQIVWRCWAGSMGARWFDQSAWHPEVLGSTEESSTARDTRDAAVALTRRGVDLLLFVGGDGTARDVVDAVGLGPLCLGVPAGVKMHSGVFATTPEAAAAIVAGLASGAFVADTEGEVRDLDEDARRAGALKTQYYGDLRIPAAGGYVQRTKEAGRENEALAVEEIAAELQERGGECLVIGGGSTCARIKSAFGLKPTLLGVDVWRRGKQALMNVDARALAEQVPEPDALIVSFVRQQGFLFGRGNQQLGTSWLGRVPKDRIHIVGSRTKLASLAGAPLLVDTDSADVNEHLTGLYPIIVGYQDALLYRVASDALTASTRPSTFRV
ncbi:MAG: NAD(+)/NADH kinase [Pseudomonadota bacterium]